MRIPNASPSPTIHPPTLSPSNIFGVGRRRRQPTVQVHPYGSTYGEGVWGGEGGLKQRREARQPLGGNLEVRWRTPICYECNRRVAT